LREKGLTFQEVAEWLALLCDGKDLAAQSSMAAATALPRWNRKFTD